MKKITVSILSAMLMLSMVFSSSVFAAEKEVSAWDSFLGLFSGKVATADTQVDGVTYRTHIENDGWAQGWVFDGEMSGSSGRGLRLEGIEIKLDDATLPEGLGITYRTHIQNDGWAQGWVSDGTMSGSSGRGLRLEAIEIKLTGDDADDYSVVYRTHIQNDGWAQGWVKDGALSGSEGRGLRLEGIEIKIEQKTADLTAYEAALAAVEEEDYTEASWAAYEAIVAENVVTADNKQSEVDAATAAIVAAQADLKLSPVVATVTAANSKALTITGVGLDNLVAADIAVADNTVTSYVGSADGKTGTAVLNSDLVVDEVTNVTIKGTVYPVTYTVAFSTLAVVPTTYDDDTANQSVAITMDGKAVTAQELTNAGYVVTYSVFTTKAATTPVAALFAPGPATATSSTGLLRTDLYNAFSTEVTGATPLPTAGVDVYVTVQAVKGSTVVSSPLAAIKIKNLNIAADSITASKLTNNAATPFIMNSRTLKTGETANYTELTVQSGSTSETVTNLFTVKSSNNAVVSVAADGTLTAQSPGTATITITYGNATKAETITVTNANREATKVNVEKANITTSISGTATSKVYLVDQFGDPVNGARINLSNSDDTVATVIGKSNAADVAGNAYIAATSVDPDDPSTITFTANATKSGTTTLTFQDAGNVKIGTTTVRVTVTNNDMLSKYNMVIDSDITTADVDKVNTDLTFALAKDDFSTNNTLDMDSDAYAIFNLSGLNSAGIGVSNPETDGTAGEYVVSVNQSRTGVIDLTTLTAGAAGTMAQDGYVLVKAGTLTGTATITVTNAANPTIKATATVTVEQVGFNVTGATFKAIESPTFNKTLTYKDALNYVEGDRDPVITGITLTKTTSYPIRLDVTTTIGNIYVDKNANGTYDALTDSIVGSMTMETVGTFAALYGGDVVAGQAVAAGDDGSVLYKVLNTDGGVVAVKEVVVNF